MRASATGSVVRAGLEDAGLITEGVTLAPMPPWMTFMLSARVAAITIRDRIYITPSRLDAVIEGADAELLAHELIHVGQWRTARAGPFLAGYVTDYVRLRVCGLSHQQAYRHIGYEWEAYAKARHIVERL